VSEHRGFAVDQVTVAAPVALALDVAGFDEVGQDALRGSEGDADCVCDACRRTLGSRAMWSNTCVWLVRNCQRFVACPVDESAAIFVYYESHAR